LPKTTTRTTTKTSNRRRGSRALALLLALATLLGACTSEAKPPLLGDVADGARFAREVADVLLTYAAYDYALAGHLAGERTRLVSPDRWSVVGRGSARTLTGLTAAAVSAGAVSRGPVRDRLIALADVLTDLARATVTYADGRENAVFARVVEHVAGAWGRLRELATTLPASASLMASIARGSAIAATAKSDSKWVLNVAPFSTRVEAEEAARAIAVSESIGTQPPFVVRVATFPSKAHAEAKAASLKGMPGSLVVEEVTWTFTRSGLAPDYELWREATRVFDLRDGTRRVALTGDGAWLAAGGDDGTVSLFDGAGTLRAQLILRVSIANLAFADDGKTLMTGGVNLAVVGVPSFAQLGPLMTLTSPATQVLFVPGAGSRSFVATAKGPTGQPAGGAGVISARAPDGVALGSPFPITTPAAGALLAVTQQGELFIATPASGATPATDVEVLRVGFERTPRALVRVSGTVRALAVDAAGTAAAILTDQGFFRFDPRAADQGKNLRPVAVSPREIAFGADSVLYTLEQTKLSAFDKDGRLAWAAALSDGRKLVTGARTVVVDGPERVLVAGAGGTFDELGSSGTVTDLSLSLDGKRLAVVTRSRRATVFDLP